MTLERGGITYVNGQEAAKFLEVSFPTWQQISQEYGLVGKKFIGQGKSLFYRKDLLELMKQTDELQPDEVEKLKAYIREAQSPQPQES